MDKFETGTEPGRAEYGFSETSTYTIPNDKEIASIYCLVEDNGVMKRKYIGRVGVRLDDASFPLFWRGEVQRTYNHREMAYLIVNGLASFDNLDIKKQVVQYILRYDETHKQQSIHCDEKTADCVEEPLFISSAPGGGDEETDFIQEDAASLEEMTITELREYAQANNVDLTGCNRKASIMQAIKETRIMNIETLGKDVEIVSSALSFQMKLPELNDELSPVLNCQLKIDYNTMEIVSEIDGFIAQKGTRSVSLEQDLACVSFVSSRRIDDGSCEKILAALCNLYQEHDRKGSKKEKNLRIDVSNTLVDEKAISYTVDVQAQPETYKSLFECCGVYEALERYVALSQCAVLPLYVDRNAINRYQQSNMEINRNGIDCMNGGIQFTLINQSIENMMQEGESIEWTQTFDLCEEGLVIYSQSLRFATPSIPELDYDDVLTYNRIMQVDDIGILAGAIYSLLDKQEKNDNEASPDTALSNMICVRTDANQSTFPCSVEVYGGFLSEIFAGFDNPADEYEKYVSACNDIISKMRGAA